ncbi:hypothetical protein GGI42DRAFT_54700 [Trichoderma sp. SZMC 28013]
MDQHTMMITEQKFTGFHVSLRMVLAQTRTSLGRKQTAFYYLFVYLFIIFFCYSLGGIFGRGWGVLSYIFLRFRYYLFWGESLALLGGLFLYFVLQIFLT